MSDVWAAIANTLADAGCTAVIGLPADEPGLLDSALVLPELHAVPVRDQRVGACLATGYAVTSGHPVALALTSGPAFPNALAGLAEAESLCAPIIVVTTRIPGDGLHRGGFQETDQRSMASSLAKWHYVIEDGRQLRWAVRRAVHLAVNGRPGITIVEVTDEVSHAVLPVDAPTVPSIPVVRHTSTADPAATQRAADILRNAERPLIVAGGGARAAGTDLVDLAESLQAPVMTTASGRGIMPERHALSAGLVGLYATPPLDQIQAQADVVLVIGSRLEETARMAWPEVERVRLIHVDVEPEVFGQVLEPEVALLGDAQHVVTDLREAINQASATAGVEAPLPPPRWEWRNQVAELTKEARSHRHEHESARPSLARSAVIAIGEEFGEQSNYVHENGLHDIWSYHFPLLPIGLASGVVVPGEQTMLGFGLPAAIGAAMARPGRSTVLICGDGALAMNVSALATAAEHELGLVIVVFDNQGFGWPRHLRALSGHSREVTRFSVPYPVGAVVQALGGVACEVVSTTELPAALREAHLTAEAGRIAVVQVRIPDDDVPPGVARVLAGDAPPRMESHAGCS